jgi:hypothetical protein
MMTPSGREVSEPMSRSARRAGQEGFDPYRRWLGVPPGRRPPTHYQLLGISPEEEDLEVIHAAALRQSAYVRNFQSGPHADLAARVLSELAEARAALTDPARRKEYDRRLARRDADQARARPPAPRPEPGPPSASEAVRPTATRRPASVARRRLPAAVAVGFMLLAAVGGGVAALRMLGGDRHPSVQSDPAGVERPPAVPGPRPARRDATELPFAVRPADATVTVVSGRATVAGEGASRRLVLPEQTPQAGEELTIRAEAKGYESVTRTLFLGGGPPRAVQAFELPPRRKWLREFRNSYWRAANPSMDLAEHSLSMQPPDRAGGYASGIFDVPGYRTFHAKVSMRPEVDGDSASPMTFAVFGDGKLLWASKPIQKRGESDECIGDVTGVRRLELRARCEGSNAHAWGAWIDPYLVECDAFAEAARAERKKRSLPAYLESESYWRPEAQNEAPPVRVDSPPRGETKPPRAPRLIPVFKVAYPGDVLLSTNEQEVKGLQKYFPGEFKGTNGHRVERLGYAYAERQPGTVLLRRYYNGNKHLFTTRKLDNPRYKEEELGAWVPQRETPGASARLGFFRKNDAASEYGPKASAASFGKLGYRPSGLQFYLFDQGGP